MADMNATDSETGDRLNLIDRVSLLISRVVMLLILVIIAAMAYEVVMRYAFSRATVWVTDLAVWLGAIGYLIAGLYAMQKRSHIAITLIYDAVPRKVRLALDALTLVVVLTFAFGLIVGAGPDAWRALTSWERMGTAWNPPIPATVKPLIILTVFLVAVQAVANFVADWRRGGRPRPSAPAEVD